LLKTYKSISLTKIGESGIYWHHGLEYCLKLILTSLNNIHPERLSLTINIDGLPIYRSSKTEFWPILFNIQELPDIKPMIIGIFCGKGKPSDLLQFLQPFVNESQVIFSNGLSINGNKVEVKLRCFVCDSPARAFIKGRYTLYYPN